MTFYAITDDVLAREKGLGYLKHVWLDSEELVHWSERQMYSPSKTQTFASGTMMMLRKDCEDLNWRLLNMKKSLAQMMVGPRELQYG